MAGRRPTMRLLVSPETATALDDSLYDAIAGARRKVSKTEFADALVRVGLAHMDEVKAFLRGEHPEEEGSDG